MNTIGFSVALSFGRSIVFDGIGFTCKLHEWEEAGQWTRIKQCYLQLTCAFQRQSMLIIKVEVENLCRVPRASVWAGQFTPPISLNLMRATMSQQGVAMPL
jgi:hypothetical protein